MTTEKDCSLGDTRTYCAHRSYRIVTETQRQGDRLVVTLRAVRRRLRGGGS